MGELKKWRDQKWVRIGTDGKIKGACGTSKNKKNPDLWQRFLEIYPKHNVKFFWVKGHSNNVENEKCDRLAVEASYKADLLEDIGYINSQSPDANLKLGI